MDLHQVKIMEVIADVKPVDGETTVSKLLTVFKDGAQAVPVFDKKKFLGLITIDKMVARDYSTETKAKSLVESSPTLTGDEDLADATKVLLQSGAKAAPVMKNGEYKGLYSEREFIKFLTKHEVSRTVSEIMNDPITIENTFNVGKARSLVRENGIGRLPVVDKEGKLVGVVDSTDFLKMEIPKESQGQMDKAGESHPEYKNSVTIIMDATPLTVDKNASIGRVVKSMNKAGKFYAIVTEDKKPVGIVTSKDIIELLVPKDQEGVYVQITGSDIADNFTKEQVHREIDENVQKLGRIFGGTEYLFVHIKTHDTQSTKPKYGIRTRLMTPRGVFISRSFGYDLIKAMGEAMDKLTGIVVEKKDMEEKTKKNMPRGIGKPKRA